MPTYLLPPRDTKHLPSPLFYTHFPESATVPSLPLLAAALAPFWRTGPKNWSHSTAAITHKWGAHGLGDSVDLEEMKNGASTKPRMLWNNKTSNPKAIAP